MDTIILNDGTDDITLARIVTKDPSKVSFVESGDSPMIHRQRLGFEFRPASQQNEGNKVTIRFNVPVPAVTTAAGVDGYVSVPKSLGENKIVVNYLVGKFATPAEAEQTYNEFLSMISNADVKKVFVDQLMNI